MRPSNLYLGSAVAALAVEVAREQPRQAPPRPEGMPEAAADWRENFARLAPTTAESPLPTRQLRRMAAKALARSLSSVQKIEERHQAQITKKRDRALAAAKKHKNGSGVA